MISMKKTILALIMILINISAYAEPVVINEQETGGVTVQTTDDALEFVGTSQKRNEYVSINILQKGKTLEDFENMTSEEDFNLTVKSTKFAVSDNDRKFSVDFDNTNGEFYGCVWVATSEGRKSSGVIVEDSVRHIVFDDDKIILDGKSDLETIHVLMNDLTGKEYKNIEVAVSDDEFFVEIPIDYSEAYDLYVTDGINKISGRYRITAPKTLYISKDGNDENNGSEDLPFATIAAAKNAAKSFKDVPVNVIIKSGEYDIDDVTSFTIDDSRTIDTPLRFVGDGEVVFSGAKALPVSKFSKVTDENVRERMYEDVRDKVVVMDLKECGVSDKLINFITRCGTAAYRNSINPVRFYLNDEEQKIARYPNEGYKRIKSVSNAGSASADSNERAVFNVGEDVSRWQTASDMFIEGAIGQPWIAEWARVQSVDGQNVTLANYTYSTVKENYKWAAVNLLEEIDIPGEYFIDSTTGLLYYYPPKNLTEEDKFEIAAYDKNVFEIDNCANLQFDGIDFEKLNNNSELSYYSTRANFVFKADNTERLLVRNCDFADIGGAAIRAWSNPHVITFDNCRFSRVVRGLGNISGGSIVKLTDADFKVKNCEISQWGRLSFVMPAIVFNGRGMKVLNSTFHDGECMAISFGGQNIKISDNEFYDVCTELSDMGAVYTGRNWTTADVDVCNNYFKNIGPKTASAVNNTVCVYTDDAINNVNIYGNIFVGRDNTRDDLNAIHYTQGPNITMDKNTFINFKNAVFISYRTESAFQTVYKTLDGIPYKSAWYKVKYPYFTTLAAYDNSWRNGNYREDSSISKNVMINTENVKVYGSDSYHWKREMYLDETDNRVLSANATVNPDENDYRIGSEFEQGLDSEIKTETNSKMSDFGTKEKYLEFKFASICDSDGNVLNKAESGQSVTLKETIDGTDFGGQNITYILTVFDEKGNLVQVTTNGIKVTPNTEKQTVISTVLPEMKENYAIKLMRLEDFANLKPVGESVIIK